MKTEIGKREEIIEKAQQFIDSFPEGSSIAIAYNEDIQNLCFAGKKTIQIMDCGNLFSDRYNFDVSVEQYAGEAIDLAVLGIGYKAQIGFNEVATPFNSTKHYQKLTDSTIEEYSYLGEIPEMGLTLGINDIVKAQNIMVLALGDKRAEAVFNMLYGRNDSVVPAAFLQIPMNVTVFVDEEAGSKL